MYTQACIVYTMQLYNPNKLGACYCLHTNYTLPYPFSPQVIQQPLLLKLYGAECLESSRLWRSVLSV